MAAVLPYAGLSLALLLLAVFMGKKEPLEQKELSGGKETGEKAGAGAVAAGILPYLLLLILCLLVVFRVLPYLPVLLCVAAVIAVVNRSLYKEVDYFLLATFLCFFLFVGNMKRIPQISSFLSSILEGNELLTGVLASQVISNVPAAILLSGFTREYSWLLTGVNLGGLGTLIASLASLISYKFFAREYPGEKGKFLKEFTLWNLGFLLILLGAAFLVQSWMRVG